MKSACARDAVKVVWHSDIDPEFIRQAADKQQFPRSVSHPIHQTNKLVLKYPSQYYNDLSFVNNVWRDAIAMQKKERLRKEEEERAEEERLRKQDKGCAIC